MKKHIEFLFVLCFFYNCTEKIPVVFEEFSIEKNKNTVIEINVPLAEVNSEVGVSINSKIRNHIANILNFGEDESNITLEDALTKFDSIYLDFKDNFEENSLPWEALFDGEVTYQSPKLICIAINSYLNTGGAHGNMTIHFLNFDAETGILLQNEALIKMEGFMTLAEKHFNLFLAEYSEENDFTDYFWGKNFHLPASIGFSDEGIILFYNVYEIAPYSEGAIEFTIPFENALPYLKLY